MSPSALFHPAVVAWFERSFRAPTATQTQAWPAIKAGRNVLIAAPREQNLGEVDIRTWVRTGDTPAGERQRMGRRPPHVVVTTPESLYVLLGSDSGRRMLAP